MCASRRSSSTWAAASSCRPSSSYPARTARSALLDVARTVVRRAERAAQPVVPEDSRALPYLNRLSSLLWILARWAEGDALPTRTTARPGRLITGGPLAPHHRTRPHRSARRGRLGGRRRGRPRLSAGIDWAYLTGQGFEAKKGDVRACPVTAAPRPTSWGSGQRRRWTPTCSVTPRGSLARAAADIRRWPVDLLGAAADGTEAAAGAQAIAEGLVLGGYESPPSSPSRSPPSSRASSSAAEASASRTRSPAGSTHRGSGVLGSRPGERTGWSLTPSDSPSRRRPSAAQPASRSPCGTRRRSGSRGSAGCSA